MKIYLNIKKSTTYKKLVHINKFFKKKINLYEPIISKHDFVSVKKSLLNKEISTYGSFTKIFEKKLKDFTKSKYVMCTNSGTSALHLALLAINVSNNDEVFMPAFSFVTAANVIRYCDATPHFLEIDEDTLGIDPVELEKYLNNNFYCKKNKLINKKTKKQVKALVAVHAYGHSPKMDDIIRICKKFKLKVIEDAAEALGTYYKNRHAGTFGDIGILSFNGNKIITTGGGGAVLTNSKKLFAKMYNLGSLAKNKSFFDYNSVGYNYKMPSFNASLGISQMNTINLRLKKKRTLYKFYKNIFLKSDLGSLFLEPINCKSNFWLQTLVIKKNLINKRNKIVEMLRKKNIQAIPGWKLLTDMKHFKKYPKANLKKSRVLSDSIINLPSNY